jgi:hypothetical protein
VIALESLEAGSLRLLHAVRIPGACPEVYLRGFGAWVSDALDPSWRPEWTETNVGGHTVWTTPLPEALSGLVVYVLVKGDVGMAIGGRSREQASDLLSNLRLDDGSKARP